MVHTLLLAALFFFQSPDTPEPGATEAIHAATTDPPNSELEKPNLTVRFLMGTS